MITQIKVTAILITMGLFMGCVIAPLMTSTDGQAMSDADSFFIKMINLKTQDRGGENDIDTEVVLKIIVTFFLLMLAVDCIYIAYLACYGITSNAFTDIMDVIFYYSSSGDNPDSYEDICAMEDLNRNPMDGPLIGRMLSYALASLAILGLILYGWGFFELKELYELF